MFCRALHDNNTYRLYVHEVFVEGKKQGNTLQTAASQPHGGIALYRDILANVLDARFEDKGTTVIPDEQEKTENIIQGLDGYTEQKVLDEIDFTTLHELVHAAYERLGQSDRNKYVNAIVRFLRSLDESDEHVNYIHQE